ncbi:GNAT family N-acetyltransferase [Kitasatospora aureofaciens]|uniref:GNAT family N-acetyltransferase n=1 Tax=Kitasatospora aureofaciens TaxID=1894 RepID=UPI001C46DCAB|nr:GNAT family N-acetyltransferase [Kitasatospora aureofaciens]MBV6699489.1 GNAT family N-acetyltransferase [Kitasatospora aureofaciens]
MTSTEYRELRAIRLEALRDSPTAFSSSYEDTAALPDDVWQQQAAVEASSEESATFIAADEAGNWVGIAGVGPLPDVPDHVHVHSVYVSPEHRGPAGPAADLMMAGIRHAQVSTDVRWLTLGVHERNGRGLAFYRRLGFEPTGKVVPYGLNPSEKLLILGYPDFRGRSRSSAQP